MKLVKKVGSLGEGLRKLVKTGGKLFYFRKITWTKNFARGGFILALSPLAGLLARLRGGRVFGPGF